MVSTWLPEILKVRGGVCQVMDGRELPSRAWTDRGLSRDRKCILNYLAVAAHIRSRSDPESMRVLSGWALFLKKNHVFS